MANPENITLRNVKGKPLTYEELDENFKQVKLVGESQSDFIENEYLPFKEQQGSDNPHPQYQLKIKDNTEGSTEPTVDDDGTQGYSFGSLWVDRSQDAPELYRCVDASENGAVWVKTSLTLDELGSVVTYNQGEADDEIRTNAKTNERIQNDAIAFSIALG